ncbi:MAG: hypothetical protein L0H84_23565 [Pseudonocardia sp.]|nr:hypothetical protein [Pseudonocardia sp.]
MPGHGSITTRDLAAGIDVEPGGVRPGEVEVVASLLGGCRIAIDGRQVDTASSRRTRGVLAYLLIHRAMPLPRDVLMDAFWPEADPSAARNRLHVALSGVRQALREVCPEPVVQRHYDTYSLSSTVDVCLDVERFEAACRTAGRAEAGGDLAGAARGYELACQLYAGDLLPGDPYLEWAVPVRERLRWTAVQAQSALMELYVRRGEYGPGAVLGRAVLAIDPANEAVHRALMRSFALTGQRHLALAQYQRLTRILWRTFRVGPSAESTAVYEALRGPAPYRYRP